MMGIQCCMQFIAQECERYDVVQDICPFKLKLLFLSQHDGIYLRIFVCHLTGNIGISPISDHSGPLQENKTPLVDVRRNFVGFSRLKVFSISPNFDTSLWKRLTRLKVRTFTVSTAKTWRQTPSSFSWVVFVFSYLQNDSAALMPML